MPPPRKSVCKRKEPTEQACLGNTTFRMTRRQVKRKGIHTHTYKGIHNNQAQLSKQSSHKLKHLHLCFLEQTWKDGYIWATQTNKSHRNAAWYFSAKLAFWPFEAKSVARNFINSSSSLSLYSHLKSPHRQHIWVMRSVLSRNVSRQAAERRDFFFPPRNLEKDERGARKVSSCETLSTTDQTCFSHRSSLPCFENSGRYNNPLVTPSKYARRAPRRPSKQLEQGALETRGKMLTMLLPAAQNATSGIL